MYANFNRLNILSHNKEAQIDVVWTFYCEDDDDSATQCMTLETEGTRLRQHRARLDGIGLDRAGFNGSTNTV